MVQAEQTRESRASDGKVLVCPRKQKILTLGSWTKMKLEKQARVKACKFSRWLDCVLSAKRSHQ